MITALLIGSFLAATMLAAIFFRLHRRRPDRFFLYFGAAFSAFALNRALLLVVDDRDETAPAVYGLRLIGFVLVAVAVLERNRAAASP